MPQRVKVVLISDTHAYLDDRLWKHLKDADELWHAGDIGNIEVMDALKKRVPVLRGVHGNIDDHTIRLSYPEEQIFTSGGCKVYMIHIVGNSKHYQSKVLQALKKHQPMLLVCGHSHILKVFYNKTFECLHMNPGAVGKHGFHKIQTFLKFELCAGKIENLEIVELDKSL